MAESRFEVRIDARVVKDLRRAPPHVVRAFDAALELLAEDPIRPRPGLDTIPLRGSPFHRLRLGGWRIILHVDPKRRIVTMLSAGPRATAYR